MKLSRARAALAPLALLAFLTACGGGANVAPAPIAAQAAPNVSVPASQQSLDVSDGDRSAAAGTKNYKTHLMAPRSGKKPRFVAFPADMIYFGGALVTSAKVYNLYVLAGYSPSFTYRANVDNFVTRLSRGYFIHVVDQYVHVTTLDRYPLGGSLFINYAAYTTLADNDILSIVHSAERRTGVNGYKAIYNVILPQNVDVCLTGVAACSASMSSPAPTFCAYHASVDYPDAAGHVLFTVEPWQDVAFCGQPTPAGKFDTPNGIFQDSTDSTLSHELIETITDPDPIGGWFDPNVGVSGEIGDLCAYLPAAVNNAGKVDWIQSEYANKIHACWAP